MRANHLRQFNFQFSIFNLQLTRMRRAALIVLDGVGIGPAPDTDQYGDTGSDTLGNVSRAAGGLALPHLEALGLGCCAPLAGIRAVEQPAAAWGIAQPVSAG